MWKLNFFIFFIFNFNLVYADTSIHNKMYGKYADKFSQHNIVFSKTDNLKDDELDFAIEILAGSNKKFEFRTSTGSLILDRTICPQEQVDGKRTEGHYPIHYGISPSIFNVDSDPVDLLVIGGDEEYSKMISSGNISTRKVKILGTIKMEECSKVPCQKDSDWEQDYKILGLDLASKLKYQDITDVPSSYLQKINEFFSTYKGTKLVSGKRSPLTRVNGVLSKVETQKFLKNNFEKITSKERDKEIQKCWKKYDKIVKSNFKVKKKLNKKYLKCLNRVPYANFFPGTSHFKIFLQYTTYEYLLKLKHKNASFDKAFEQMESRRQNKETYYRYVTFDEPSPGTRKPIFEFIKTKDRSHGCPENFPAQHYESMPLIMQLN